MWQRWWRGRGCPAICPGLNLRLKDPEITGIRGQELHRVSGEESVGRVTFNGHLTPFPEAQQSGSFKKQFGGSFWRAWLK